MAKKVEIYRGSGNVFADIGVAHPERALARSEIMMYITDVIEKRKLTQKQAAKILGIPQSKVSCLVNGKLSMFSLDLLLELLNKLGKDVEIRIRPKKKNRKMALTWVS